MIDFTKLLHPVSPEQFNQEYFEKKHLYISREDASYYDNLITLENIDKILSDLRMRGDFDLRMANDNQVIKRDDITRPIYTNQGSFKAVHLPFAYAQFTSGSTIILEQFNAKWKKMATFCDSIAAFYPGFISTNIYITPENSIGFGKHFDNTDVFILQIHGKKTWELYESPVAIPLNTERVSMDIVNKQPKIAEYELTPGEVLYLPRGVIHHPYTKDESSIHATISLNTLKWKDIAINMINAAAHENQFLRSTVPMKAFQEASDSALDKLSAILALFQDKNKIQRGINKSFAKHEQGQAFTSDQMLTDLLSVEKVNQQTVVKLRTPKLYIEEKEEEIVVTFKGNNISLPQAFKGEIEWIIEKQQFKVADFSEQLSPAGKEFFIKKLIKEGLLIVDQLNVHEPELIEE